MRGEHRAWVCTCHLRRQLPPLKSIGPATPPQRAEGFSDGPYDACQSVVFPQYHYGNGVLPQISAQEAR